MHQIDELLRLTREREPWALARFNDGEMTAISKRSGKISRGLQEVTPSLADALKAAMKYRRRNYWIGLPCRVCWKKHRAAALKLCNPMHYQHTTLAVVLTNRNHKRWQEEFPPLLVGRRVVWVGPKEQDTMNLPFCDEIASRVFVAKEDAWRWAEECGLMSFGAQVRIVDTFSHGDVVLISCGPLGRVLAHLWFDARPDLTIIDVGSIYDPITLGTKTARIHKGTLPRCKGCN